MQVRDLDPGVAERLNLPKDTGVVVGEVFENTPASKAGLEAGDIITAIAGKRVGDSKMLQGIVAGLPLREPVEVNLFRDGKSMKLNVTVEEQPEAFGRDNVPAPRRLNPEAAKTSLGNTGLDVADLSDDMADDLGFRKGTRGVVITDVKSGSVAADAGLKRGMLIVRIDNERVANAAAARTVVEKASLQKGVLLQVQSPTGGVNYVMLKSEA